MKSFRTSLGSRGWIALDELYGAISFFLKNVIYSLFNNKIHFLAVASKKGSIISLQSHLRVSGDSLHELYGAILCFFGCFIYLLKQVRTELGWF